MIKFKKSACALFLLMIVILLVNVQNSASAAPVYGGNIPGSRHWDIGLQTNFILEHEMKTPQGEIKSRQYFFLASYGFFDWLCFDGKIGIGDITQEPDAEPKGEYNLNFAGGYGLRACLYQGPENTQKIILGFQHISVHPNDVIINDKKNEAIFDDWQISLLYAGNIEKYYPYLGIKFSRGDLIRRVDVQRKRRHPAENIGIFLGTDYALGDNLRLSIEARFLDENSVSFAVIRSY
ncbi:MAG: hypothetical protein ABH952_09435 [Candidatus Omnitrophota bacterium]